MKENRKFLLACACASLAPAMTLTALTTEISYDFVLGSLFFLLIYLLSSITAGTFYGFPLYYFAHRFHLARWWTAVPAGAIVGSITAWMTRDAPEFSQVNSIVLISLGSASGFVFFSVYKWLGSVQLRVD